MEEIDYTRHYSKYHDGSAEIYSTMERYFELSMRGFLPRDHSQPILEIGCGMGFALNELRKAGYTNVTGIDVDPGQVAAAKAHSLPALHVPIAAQDEFVAAHRDHY